MSWKPPSGDSCKQAETNLGNKLFQMSCDRPCRVSAILANSEVTRSLCPEFRTGYKSENKKSTDKHRNNISADKTRQYWWDGQHLFVWIGLRFFFSEKIFTNQKWRSCLKSTAENHIFFRFFNCTTTAPVLIFVFYLRQTRLALAERKIISPSPRLPIRDGERKRALPLKYKSFYVTLCNIMLYSLWFQRLIKIMTWSSLIRRYITWVHVVFVSS